MKQGKKKLDKKLLKKYDKYIPDEAKKYIKNIPKEGVNVHIPDGLKAEDLAKIAMNE